MLGDDVADCYVLRSGAPVVRKPWDALTHVKGIIKQRKGVLDNNGENGWFLNPKEKAHEGHHGRAPRYH